MLVLLMERILYKMFSIKILLYLFEFSLRHTLFSLRRNSNRTLFLSLTTDYFSLGPPLNCWIIGLTAAQLQPDLTVMLYILSVPVRITSSLVITWAQEKAGRS